VLALIDTPSWTATGQVRPTCHGRATANNARIQAQRYTDWWLQTLYRARIRTRM